MGTGTRRPKWSLIVKKCLTVRSLSALTVASALLWTHPAMIADAPNKRGFSAARPAAVVDVRALVKARASRAGWTYREWRALAELIRLESSWRPDADNPHSSAYGLFQMLHLDPATPLRRQVELGVRYIRSRYGSPSAALAFHRKHGWY